MAARAGQPAEPTIWTIGHSTRAIDEFRGLLMEEGIELLADVRQHPGSRRFPRFNREALAAALDAVGIGYIHLPELGGRREPRAESPNTAWKEPAFRGYADYMETAAFNAALDALLAMGRARRTAIMCAEARWRECHRGLIADALKARGVTVLHIGGREQQPEEHPYTAAASVVGGKLSYRGKGELFGDGGAG